MKILFSVVFALIIWALLYKMLFDDFEDFKESAKKNVFWAVIDEFIFSAAHTTTGFAEWRFLIFLAAGILGAFALSLIF